MAGRVSCDGKAAGERRQRAEGLEAAGGRFLARGVAAQAYEAGQRERTVVIEFESVAGGKMRIHWKAATPPDWAHLLRAWRDAEG